MLPINIFLIPLYFCVCAGLDVEVDRILEIACIITDGNLTKSVEVFSRFGTATRIENLNFYHYFIFVSLILLLDVLWCVCCVFLFKVFYLSVLRFVLRFVLCLLFSFWI